MRPRARGTRRTLGTHAASGGDLARSRTDPQSRPRTGTGIAGDALVTAEGLVLAEAAGAVEAAAVLGTGEFPSIPRSRGPRDNSRICMHVQAERCLLHTQGIGLSGRSAAASTNAILRRPCRPSRRA